MKADRLLELLLLLQARPRCTARELAVELEISERTVYRDVESLAAAGVPVFAERGANGGIALSEGYRRALLQFGDEEIQALFIAGSSLVADLGLGGKGERALEKLRGGLSDIQRRAAESVRGRIYIDQRRWFQSDPSVERLSLLRRAVWDDRTIALRYKDREGKLSDRSAEPYGLVSKAGVWYVIARTDAGFRSFRVDRIVEVRIEERHFQRDPAFLLENYWRETAARMVSERPAFAATARIDDEDVRATLCGYYRTESVNPGDDRVVRVYFSSEAAAVRNAIAWGDSVELLDPPSVRVEIARHARAIAGRYSAIRLKSPSKSATKRKKRAAPAPSMTR
ncbi:MAG: helix-turn-helix transcriptional regulator [Candidatus Baltobacteraceae bacterium]